MNDPRRPVMLELTCGLLAATAVGLSVQGTEQSHVLLFSICVGLVVGGIAIAELMSHLPPGANDFAGTWGRWAGASFVVIASVGILNWPLRVSYELSCGAMDEAASRVVADAEFAKARRTVLFSTTAEQVPDEATAGAASPEAESQPGELIGGLGADGEAPPLGMCSLIRPGPAPRFLSQD